MTGTDSKGKRNLIFDVQPANKLTLAALHPIIFHVSMVEINEPQMPCPICEKTSNKDYRPFCSKRCADIDLGKWLSNGYAIPGAPLDEAEETPDFSDKADPKLH